MPARDDLTVDELLPWRVQLALVEAGSGEEFHITHCGLQLIRRLGREATGCGVRELAPDIGAHLAAILTTTCRVAAPVAAVSHVQLGRVLSSYSEVALPLAGADGPVAAILLGSQLVYES
jgi:hypothetical protein